MRKPILTLGALAVLTAVIHGAELKPETAAAFARYVALTEQRIDGEVGKPEQFLWVDTLPANRKAEVMRSLQAGQVSIERLRTRDGAQEIDAQGGLIHHWVGTILVPGASVDQAVALMQDFNRHSSIFAPAIIGSRILEHQGDRFRVALRFQVKKIITVTLDTENDAQFFRDPPHRAHSRLRSTKVVEIADAGTPQEKPKASGQENGFLWNLNTYWRFFERDGGTYIQCESVSLSRDVPLALAWIIRPIVTQTPRDSLTFTLAKAREALIK